MKWFKHHSDLRYDTKIRRVISKFGVSGYGVYNYILESITQNLEPDSPIPFLEDTACDIAEYLKMDTLRVEEIVKFCLEQELFETDEITGRLLCAKIYKFLDTTQTRSPEIRMMIKTYYSSPNNPELSETVSDSPRQSETVLTREEETRTEEIREENSLSSKTDEDIGLKPMAILNLYNSICTSLPRATKMTDKRHKSINALKGMFKADEIEEGFRKAQSNSFLNGGGTKRWKADFDWLINRNNLLKVLEGRYDENTTTKSKTHYLEGVFQL